MKLILKIILLSATFLLCSTAWAGKSLPGNFYLLAPNPWMISDIQVSETSNCDGSYSGTVIGQSINTGGLVSWCTPKNDSSSGASWRTDVTLTSGQGTQAETCTFHFYAHCNINGGFGSYGTDSCTIELLGNTPCSIGFQNSWTESDSSENNDKIYVLLLPITNE